MRKVKIVSDSTLDIDQSIIEDLQIDIIPLSIFMEGKSYLDRVDIKPDEFIDKMKQSSELPKSSQPPIGKFVEVYEKWIGQGYDIISIHLASTLSGTYSAAQTAAKMVDGRIEVVNSMFISKALGFQVVEAANMALRNKSIDEILTKIREIRENTYLYITVDTLENLVKGGRIGRGKALIGSLLNIKPIAKLQDGVYTPISKVRSHSQVVKALTEQFFEDVKGKQVQSVGIAHVNAVELAEKIKREIINKIPDLHIEISFTTPVISTHTGTGAIGFMYYTD